MAAAGIILIIGAGPGVGKSIASKFAASGYKVAVAARSAITGLSADGTLSLKTDLSDPAAVPLLFKQVEEKWGPPNIVVYNAALPVISPPEDPLALPLQTVIQGHDVCFNSAYVAAQESLRSFKNAPESLPKAFIYTGNALNKMKLPGFMPFGFTKTAAAMMVDYAAAAYGGSGFRFYYADERKTDGAPVAREINGPAHAEMYWELANEKKQSNYWVTFVKGTGRQVFPA